MNQLALSADAAELPNAYGPDHEQVLKRLRSIFDVLRGAPAWPWEQSVIDLHRERTLPYLYDLLGDEDEASLWSARIEAEMARLNASSIPF